MAKKRTTAKRETAARESRLRAHFGTALAVAARNLILALPLAALIGGAICGAVELWRAGLEDPRYRVPATVRLAEPGQFCTDAVDEYERLGRAAAGRSLLDPFLLHDLVRTYEKSVWVRRVCRMERVFPDRVAVEFVPRVPVAQVLQNQYYWLVGADGVLLPTGTRKPRPGLPIIQGNISFRPAHEGARWDDTGLRDALDVLQRLGKSVLADELPLKRIVVRRASFLDELQLERPALPRLDLETGGGVTILWGTHNRDDLPDEPSAAEKIAMLRTLLARNPPRVPGLCLDVRGRVAGYSLPQSHRPAILDRDAARR